MTKTRLCGYDKKTNKLHCFACNETYDILDLVKQDFNITDNKEAYKQLCNILNIQDIQYMQNNKAIKHKQDIPKDAKIIPLKATAEADDQQEQELQQQYDFTKIIQSLYDEQTDEHKQHFKDRRTYRQNY